MELEPRVALVGAAIKYCCKMLVSNQISFPRAGSGAIASRPATWQRGSLCRRLLWIALLSLSSRCLPAQGNRIDSLKILLARAQHDSVRVNLLAALSYQYENYKPDTALLLAQEGLMLSNRSNYTYGKATCLSMIGLVFMTTGNYPLALQYMLQSLKASEALEDPPSIATALENIGVIYALQKDYRLGVTYQLRALPLNRRMDQQRNVAITLLDLGDNYEKLNILDSALYYTGQSYQLAKQYGGNDLVGIALNNYGNIYAKSGPDSVALRYYRSGIPYLVAEQDEDDLCETYTSLARLFQKAGNNDSCLYYGRLSRDIAVSAGFTDEVLNASNFLSSYFASKHLYDSAYLYQAAAVAAKDSLFSQEKVREIQALQFSEVVRQQQLREADQRAHTLLTRNLLVMGIAALLVVSFVLYRGNRQKRLANRQLQQQKEEINVQKNKAEMALSDLQAAQAQLVHAEKMASLGELTAGIAHEIQNPLNFVNNFSEVNSELIDEMAGESNPDAIRAIAANIRANNEKITFHGKRADAIVKAMLQHSASRSGHKEPLDINALCVEYLTLSYHGIRSRNKDFIAETRTDLDRNVGTVRGVAQDIRRVLLNICNNAFYALNERAKEGEQDYRPEISIITKRLGGRVTIRITDNGTGIPDALREKIFQPFFTTKPTGEGTGLGLSLSYDIVKAHGGDLRLHPVAGGGACFVIDLPG